MISRRILAAVALLCVMIAPAHAQKSKAALTTEINTNWPDNTSGAITPSLLRSTVIDIVNSYVDWLTCTGTGGVVYWSGGIPTCLAAGINGQQLVLSSGIPAWANLGSSLNAGTCITITGTITPTIGITSACINTAQMANNAITNAILAQMSANGLKGNNTNGASNVLDLTPGQVGSILCTPVRTVLLSGTAATYTTPTCNGVTATWLEVDVQGGGGGGGGSGTGNTSPNFPTAGNASSFGALSAGGATTSASIVAPGGGGACSGSLGTQQNFPGSPGNAPAIDGAANSSSSGAGGSSFYGGAGGSNFTGNAGVAAPANSGGGGSGGAGSATGSVLPAAGGGAGCHIRTVIVSPVAATYTYTVGASVSGGTASTSGFAGGGGAAGLIDILAHWQ